MQFLVTGHDGKDADALQRRLAARAAHLAQCERMKAEGTLLFAAAILDEHGTMIGSMLVTEFENRDALDRWLNAEPYITGKVWQQVAVEPCKVAPIFSR